MRWEQGDDRSDRPSCQGFVQTGKNLRGQCCNAPGELCVHSL